MGVRGPCAIVFSFSITASLLAGAEALSLPQSIQTADALTAHVPRKVEGRAANSLGALQEAWRLNASVAANASSSSSSSSSTEEAEAEASLLDAVGYDELEEESFGGSAAAGQAAAAATASLLRARPAKQAAAAAAAASSLVREQARVLPQEAPKKVSGADLSALDAAVSSTVADAVRNWARGLYETSVSVVDSTDAAQSVSAAAYAAGAAGGVAARTQAKKQVPEEESSLGTHAWAFVVLGGLFGFFARGWVPKAQPMDVPPLSESFESMQQEAAVKKATLAEPEAAPAVAPPPPAAAQAAPGKGKACSDDGKQEDPSKEKAAAPAPPPKGKAPPLPGQAKGGKGPPPPGAKGAKGPPLPAPPAKGKAQKGGKPAGKGKTAGKGAKEDAEAGGGLAPPFGKRVHWRVLADWNLEKTVFGEIDPYGPAYPPLNVTRIRDLFLAQQPAFSNALAEGQKNGRKGLRQSETNANQVCLLSEKWAQNFQIIMRQVQVPTDDLCDVLMQLKLDEGEVSVDLLDHVASNLLPPLLENTKLFEYKGDPSELRAIERLLFPLTKVPRLQARVRVLLFHSGIEAKYSALMGRIETMRSGCTQLRKSTCMKHLLASGLRVGNYLNYGQDADAEGIAHGIATTNLLKLSDFRTSHTGDASALHCVVLHLQTVNIRLPWDLLAELSSVVEGRLCKRDEVSEIFDEVKGFVEEANFVVEEAKNGEPLGYTDEPLSILRKCGTEAADWSNRLQVEWASCYDYGLRVLEYFGERANYKPDDEEGPAALQRFFVSVKDLSRQLEAAWKELIPAAAKVRADKDKDNESLTVGGKTSSAPSVLEEPHALTDEELANRVKEPCLQQ
eukprot:TRINITY_DN30959_c0_g1_i1.p1 TRINITY_DN30959_c0_g1~~TRINITY_DN30959_c0_g1_i1.p1  ORF type:complete len:847 (+),score=252.17 TRINITY_DN30959_c0_g1_i1:104-2644(+)